MRQRLTRMTFRLRALSSMISSCFRIFRLPAGLALLSMVLLIACATTTPPPGPGTEAPPAPTPTPAPPTPAPTPPSGSTTIDQAGRAAAPSPPEAPSPAGSATTSADSGRTVAGGNPGRPTYFAPAPGPAPEGSPPAKQDGEPVKPASGAAGLAGSRPPAASAGTLTIAVLDAPESVRVGADPLVVTIEAAATTEVV